MVEKKNNPTFRRQDSHKKGRLGSKWRTARGLQSKVRLAKKGYCKKPKTGYRNAKSVRDLIQNTKFIEVERLSDLENIPKDHAILIKKIGTKNKIEIIKKAIASKIKILNMKNPEEFLKAKEDEMKKKKEAKKAKESSKEKKKAEAEKKAKEKEAETKKEESKEKTEVDLEAEKKAEAEKKNKILTHKDQ